MCPWASPIVLVKKHTPEGVLQQFCLWTDYRKIELLTTGSHTSKEYIERYFTLIPLLKVNELFALLKGAKYFTALDL